LRYACGQGDEGPYFGFVILDPLVGTPESPVRIRPLLCATITAAALACLTAAPATASVRHSPGGGTDVVEYECRPGAGVTGETQRIRVQVELTMPTGAWPGVELVIGWRRSE